MRLAKTPISLGICLLWSVFAVRMKASVLGYPWSAQWILWSDWADAQAHLSLHWALVIVLVFSCSGLNYFEHCFDKMSCKLFVECNLKLFILSFFLFSIQPKAQTQNKSPNHRSVKTQHTQESSNSMIKGIQIVRAIAWDYGTFRSL